MNVAQFIAKWRRVQLTERSAAQQHFLDLCELLGHPKPAEADPEGASFTFERGAAKRGGGDGWADVWKKGFFGWEYKGKHKDLAAAYAQLLQYYEAIENPPLLVVCDMDRLEVHTHFNNTAERVHAFSLADLAQPGNLDTLRRVFFEPDSLRPDVELPRVTEEAARRIGELAQCLRDRGLPPRDVARFLDRIVFCLFAEDIGLLRGDLFTQLLKNRKDEPERFTRALRQLFDAMAQGGDFGPMAVPHVNGDLFADAAVLELTADEIEAVYSVSQLDWSAIKPSIFGTLFERGLDPSKRSQLGAHYTSEEDIKTLVEPVVMQPLRREWAELRATLECLLTTGKKNVAQPPSAGPLVVPPSGGPSLVVRPSGGLVGAGPRARPLADAGQAQGPAPTEDRVNAGLRTRKRLTGAALKKARHEAEMMVNTFLGRLARVKVLDPACGSGNFLYVTLQMLKNLEKAVITFAADNDLGRFFPFVNPTQLCGIEINPYAHELAQMTVWIGYLQWARDNGFWSPEDPVLRPMTGFECKDAILERREAPFVVPPLGGSSLVVPPLGGSSPSAPTQPERPPEGGTTNQETPPEGGTTNVEWAEPEWPKVDFIVGNPPFLGGKFLRRELGDEYVDALFQVYKGRVPAEADLCCYWLEKARKQIEQGNCQRAGLLATQAIRGGANREVLKHIKATGDVFFAESDRPWVLDGANVHISMVAFDAGQDKLRILDGKTVEDIGPQLSSAAGVDSVTSLADNHGVSFMGITPAGAFDIDFGVGIEFMSAPNPSGMPNSDVVRPYFNGKDLNQRPRQQWTIDFGLEASIEVAARYEQPFEHVARTVKPARDKNNREAYRLTWWLYAETRPAMRSAFAAHRRFLATCMVAKHRLFVWLPSISLPANVVIVFARSDDYFFGVLHSRLHEVWALRLGTRLETRPRYTPTTCFETFPLPCPTPEQEAAIGEAARELNELRERWLNPPEWTRVEVLEFPGTVGGPWDRYIVGDSVGGASLPREETARGPETARLQEDAPRGPGTARLQGSIGLVRYARLVPRDAECAKKLKSRTLTNLYNERPAWLDLAHKKLDEAVFAAYGWPPAMGDEEILERMLALNLERARQDG